MNLEFHPSSIEAVVSDMDGVLWRGDTPLPGLKALFRFVREHDMPVVLATNNASKTPGHYVARLAAFGVTATVDEILTSSLATADYLAAQHEPGTAAYVVGGAGLGQAMRDAGFSLVRGTEIAAGVVVVGVDFNVTYQKLADAAVHVQRGGRFVATNTDPSYPAEAGLLPGAGSIVAAIATCTGQQPEVVGKPGRAMFDIAARRTGFPHHRVVMVGDRLETDIRGANDAGMKSVLVTSGVDDEEAIKTTGITPDAVYSGLDSFIDAWEKAIAES